MPESDASAREANSQLQGKIQRSSATFSQSRPAIYQTSYYESIPIIMNALANSMQKIALQTGRRFVSSASHAPKAPFVPEMYNYSFKKAFLSDSGTYPLIAVLATASFFIIGMSTNALMNYKNIRITPAHKHEVIQDWGTEHVDTVIQRLAKRPIAVYGYAQGFKDIQKEGLGINHEEWKKGKEAYSRGE